MDQQYGYSSKSWITIINRTRFIIKYHGLAIALCFSALYFGPFSVLKNLEMMPGHLGDPRLNNYFLENIYLYLKGNSESLWHLGFFYPFKYIGGLSDNLFGACPPYLISRYFGARAETAYQIWFLAAYPANFISAYVIFRRWSLSASASAIGSLIFSYSLPVTAFSDHSQLQYRFPVPLATDSLFRIISTGKPKHAISLLFWLTWQFYISIYLGFFLLIFLLAILFWGLFDGKTNLPNPNNKPICKGSSFSDSEDRTFYLKIILILSSIYALLFPYIEITHSYKIKRSIEEILTYIPRPESYLFTNISPAWRLLLNNMVDLAAPWEHQLFIGFIPVFLFLFGIARFVRENKKNQHQKCLMFALFSLILMTLHLGDLSPWRLVGSLPLASAIRAVGRIELVLLLPIAYFCAYALNNWRQGFFTRILLLLLLLEMVWVDPPTSYKSEWQARISAKENKLPKELAPDTIIFFSQADDREDSYFDEIDAMWLAMTKGLKTMNGYSGSRPPGVSETYGTNCAEAVQRVLNYQDLTGDPSPDRYQKLMKRILLIGFEHCDARWLEVRPTRNGRSSAYPEGFFKSIRLEILGTRTTPRGNISRIKIENNNKSESLEVGGDHPVLISWRWIDTIGNPLSGWDYRISIPFDIPANQSLIQDILIGTSSNPPISQQLEFSLVHEHQAWAHDHGLQILRVRLNDRLSP